ncbi:MAG: hypothetical protein ASARMPREDX12_004359 [Alectoria sarmentosa]|nr:MAG: hypothetical protein ASARMPREDX12_004359 [Alectoria sarmentosa]
MDPLSLTASILAVIGASSAIGRGLKKTISARRVPDILLQLNNEVTDLQYVVQDIEDLLRQKAQTSREDRGLLPSYASLSWALGHTKQTLLGLESLIAYELSTVDSRDGRTKINWISWLRAESKVKSLKDDIRTDRVRLSSALSLLASSLSLGLHDQMRRISFTMETLKLQVAQTSDTFMKSQAEQTLILCGSQQAVIPQFFQKDYNDFQASRKNTGVENFATSLRRGQSQSSQSDAAVMVYDQLGGPELCLRVVRVRSHKDNIFDMATRSMEEVSIDRIKLLLVNGEASVLDVDPYGRSALQLAVISAKADVNSRTRRGVTAVHMAAKIQGGTTFMETLLSCGASIESPDDAGLRPLHSAVLHDQVANLKLLLRSGANINAASPSGVTALMLGVWFNAHETLKLLLYDKALEYDGEDTEGRSVLHYAALYGDLETLNLLQCSHQMKKVNLDGGTALAQAKLRRDHDRTSTTCVTQPSDKDPLVWYSAFEALWNSIVKTQQRGCEGDPEASKRVIEGESADDEEDPEVWEDAHESMDLSFVSNCNSSMAKLGGRTTRKAYLASRGSNTNFLAFVPLCGRAS